MNSVFAQRQARLITVLLLEDDAASAVHLEEIVTSCGYDVVGPVGNVKTALELLGCCRVDMALLDLKIEGLVSFEVGRRCQDLKIPWGMVTGYPKRAEQYKEVEAVPVLAKPVNAPQIRALLSALGSK